MAESDHGTVTPRSKRREIAALVAKLIGIAAATIVAMSVLPIVFLTAIKMDFFGLRDAFSKDTVSVPVLVAVLVPLGVGWYFYIRALRSTARRLHLNVPVWAIGIPFFGEFLFLKELRHPLTDVFKK